MKLRVGQIVLDEDGEQFRVEKGDRLVEDIRTERPLLDEVPMAKLQQAILDLIIKDIEEIGLYNKKDLLDFVYVLNKNFKQVNFSIKGNDIKGFHLDYDYPNSMIRQEIYAWLPRDTSKFIREYNL